MLGSAVWRELNSSHHLIGERFGWLVYRGKQDVLPPVSTARNDSGVNLISSRRVGLPRCSITDRVGSSRLGYRCSPTFSVITSRLLPPTVIIIGQLYIDLTIGIKILFKRQNVSGCYQLGKNQRQPESLPKEEESHCVRPHGQWIIIK
jgi:hypothetical protein